MRRPFTKLYVQLVWATWDRLPLITTPIEEGLKAAILAAIGLVADHVHLLTSMPPSISVSDLVKHVKGASSHFVTHVIRPDTPFKWQGAYGALTLSADDMPILKAYVKGQKRHHAGEGIRAEWEQVSGE